MKGFGVCNIFDADEGFRMGCCDVHVSHMSVIKRERPLYPFIFLEILQFSLYGSA